MATKRTKTKAVAQTPADQAQAIWLAGLGAVSIAQKRGAVLFKNLTREGSDFQARTAKFVSEVQADATAQFQGALAPIKARAKSDAALAGAAVQHAIASVLGKLGIPSKRDIEELTTRVTALSRQLKTR